MFGEVSPYSDMIIFFLNAPLHSPPHIPHHGAQQTAHTLSVSAFSLSFTFFLCVTPTDVTLCHPSCTFLNLSFSEWKPHYILLPDLQTQSDRRLESPCSRVAVIGFVFVYMYEKLQKNQREHYECDSVHNELIYLFIQLTDSSTGLVFGYFDWKKLFALFLISAGQLDFTI